MRSLKKRLELAILRSIRPSASDYWRRHGPRNVRELRCFIGTGCRLVEVNRHQLPLGRWPLDPWHSYITLPMYRCNRCGRIVDFGGEFHQSIERAFWPDWLVRWAERWTDMEE